MKKIVAFLAVVALAAPALGANSDNLIIQEMDNGDGSYTYWIDVVTTNEVTFMELWIHGNIHQNFAGGLYDSLGPEWAPAVIFTSDQELAQLADPVGYNPVGDSIIVDKIGTSQIWPGKVEVSLDPPNDGTSQIHVALASFTGGVGGPLPGGPIPLAHITTWGRHLHIEGRLQTDTDPNNEFYFWVPEPSTAMLAAFGLMGLVAGLRRRK